MRTPVIILNAILLLTACTAAPESIVDAAKRSDFIVIANVDTNSGAVLCRMERLISSRNSAAFPIVSNAPIEAATQMVRPRHSYGEQQLVFLKNNGAALRVIRSVTLVNGRSVGTGEPLDVVITKITDAIESK